MIATKSRISDWSSNQLASMLKRRSQAPEVFRSILDQGYPGWPSRDSLGAESPLNHYRGEIFAAIRCITQRIAGQPIHVAKVVKPKGNNKGFAPPAPGTKRLDVLQMANLPAWVRNRLRLPMHKDFGDRVRAIKSAHSDAVRVDILEYHPLLELLSAPNPRFFQHTLLEISVVSLETGGKCFWWLDDSKSSRKKFELWALPSEWVSEEKDNVLLDKGYIIQPPHAAAPEKKVRADRMIYFYYPDPANPFSAYSPMRAAIQAVQIDESIMASQRAGFDNGLFPYLMFIMGDVIDPTGENLGPLQLERWQLNEFDARIRQLYQGVNRHGKYLVGDRFIKDAKFLSHKPHEMDWRESGEYNRDRIWRIMGVPRVIAGDIQDANRATALVADESFTQNTVNPKITMMSAVINDRLLPLFSKEEDIICWIEESVSTDRDAQLKEIELLLTNGGMELDEVRSDMGRPALPNNLGKNLVTTAMQIFVPVEPGAADALAQREQLSQQEGESREIVEGSTGRDDISPPASEMQDDEKSFVGHTKDFTVAWLKLHGRNEKPFVDDCQRFLRRQVNSIVGRVESLPPAEQIGRDVTVDELFNPRDWDEGLRSLAEPHLKRSIYAGAAIAWQRHGKSAALATKDGILMEIPLRVQERIQRQIDDSLTRLIDNGSWPNVNDTTRQKLSFLIQESLLDGDSAMQLARRISREMGPEWAGMRALRIARTSTTGALNSGQLAVIEDLENEGISSKAIWLAVKDEHTRATHYAADHQEADAEGYFDIGGHKARFPGDPDLPVEEVVNCRCALSSR